MKAKAVSQVETVEQITLGHMIWELSPSDI